MQLNQQPESSTDVWPRKGDIKMHLCHLTKTLLREDLPLSGDWKITNWAYDGMYIDIAHKENLPCGEGFTLTEHCLAMDWRDVSPHGPGPVGSSPTFRLLPEDHEDAVETLCYINIHQDPLALQRAQERTSSAPVWGNYSEYRAEFTDLIAKNSTT